MPKKLPSLMPALYSHRLAEIQEVARDAGYAIAVHGSMQRDLDLIAVPWTKDAVASSELIHRLCKQLRLNQAGASELRPHRRRVWTLMMGGSCFVDLSVIPPMIRSMDAESVKWRTALEEIAKQRLTHENEQGADEGDYEYGYDAIVAIARKALADQ